MAFKITFPFYTVSLKISDAAAVAVPITDQQAVFHNSESEWLASDFQKGFQEKVINKGDYFSLMNNFSEANYEKDSVALEFAAARDGMRHPAFELSFDFFYKQNKNSGYWAIIPALGLESYADNAETLRFNIIQTIRLEFARKQRMESVQKIISTIWYNDMTLHKDQVEFEVYTPTELENLSEQQQQQLLPLVARKLTIPQQVVYGRKKELETLVRAMKGKFGRNILLVGPSGVGKTALVHELVHQRKKLGITPEFHETTASMLIKELTRDTGWQDNLAYLCRELSKKGDVLFVRNFLELFEVGQYQGNSVSIAEYMRSYISRGEISIISECTDEEFARIEVRSPNYPALFQVIRLEEPKKGLDQIIIKKIKDVACKLNVIVEKEAVEETIRLNRRYTPYSGFPGKPIRFLESILINHKTEDKKTAKNVLSRSEVIKNFCEETGMPPFMVDPSIPMNLNEIGQFFKSNIFGQEKAVDTVVDLLASVKTALTRQGKPITSLLFVGPTGVGKTEMAKVLAQFMFGSRDKMIRFDMSEYSTPYSVLRLTGESYFKDGLLTSAVRRNPFCVILFDEIEKAHPIFYDLLLQILGEGRLTDSSGQLVNFCSTIIIMTSNIGAAKLQGNRVGWKKELDTVAITDHFTSEVRKHFRPELFNRIDQVIPFEPLTKEVIRHVVTREIELFKKHEGIQYRKADFYIGESVPDYLGEVGYDPKYGARQLQRAIREKLITPLAHELNAHDADEQLVVNLDIVDKQPQITIDSDPFKIDLLLEELTRNEYADHASSLRRSIHALTEGRVFIQLLSELDMMETKKEKKRKKFWSNKTMAEKYTYYLSTKENMSMMQGIIEGYEEELALVVMDLKPYNPSIIDDIKIWEAEYFNLKKELFMRLNPQSKLYYFSIYGRDLDQIISLYYKLFQIKNFDVTAEALWYRESYYKKMIVVEEEMEIGPNQFETTEIKRERREYIKTSFEHLKTHNETNQEQEGDILVGIEFMIQGDCPSIYLEEEIGFHQWEINAKLKNMYLIESSLNPITPPPDLHRNSFFEKRKPRRIYKETSLTDKNYKMTQNVEKWDFSDGLVEILDKIFITKLDVALF